MKASQTFCVSLLACTWHSQSPGTHGSFETPYSHAYLFSNLFFPRLLGLLLVPSAVPGPTLLRPAAVPIKAFSKNPWKRPQPWECPVLEGATRQTHTHNHSSWEMEVPYCSFWHQKPAPEVGPLSSRPRDVGDGGPQHSYQKPAVSFFTTFPLVVLSF